MTVRTCSSKSARSRASQAEAPEAKGGEALSARDPSASPQTDRPDTKTEASSKERDSEADSRLSEEQQELLASLPESQAEAIEKLPADEQSTLLDLLAVDGQLDELSPQLAALLEGASVKELQALENLLGQFQQSLSELEEGPAVLAKLEDLLAQSGLSEELQKVLLTQTEALVAQASAFDVSALGSQMAQLEQVAKKLSQVLSGTQSPTLAQAKSAIQAGDNPFWQSLADNSGVNMEVGEDGNKASIVKLQTDKLFDGFMLQAGDKGRVVSEAAQLHNLFSARGESAADRTSVSHIANLAQLTQPASQTSGQVRVPAVQTQLGASFQAPNWGQAVNQKVIWLAQQGIKSAEIRLDPAGPRPLACEDYRYQRTGPGQFHQSPCRCQGGTGSECLPPAGNAGRTRDDAGRRRRIR